MTYPHYWPSVNHPLWWIRVGVSTIPYQEQKFRVLPLPVGTIVYRAIWQPDPTETAALNPDNKVKQRRGRFPLV